MALAMQLIIQRLTARRFNATRLGYHAGEREMAVHVFQVSTLVAVSEV